VTYTFLNEPTGDRGSHGVTGEGGIGEGSETVFIPQAKLWVTHEYILELRAEARRSLVLADSKKEKDTGELGKKKKQKNPQGGKMANRTRVKKLTRTQKRGEKKEWGCVPSQHRKKGSH